MSVQRHLLRTGRVLAVAATGVAAVVSFAGPASAKASAGVVTFSTLPAPAPAGTCSPVKSFKHSTVVGVGDTGLSAVSVDYSVKPCDSKQAVTVEVAIAEEFAPGNVLYDNPQAPLSGRVGTGIQLETWYRITITVRDAVTGATVGSASAGEFAHRPTGA
jgi:hypothetical protein